MTTPAIMAFIPASSRVVGESMQGTWADWPKQKLYQVSVGTGSTNGLRQYDIYPNGSEILARTIGDMAINGIADPATLTPGGLLAFPRSASNSCLLYFVRADDLTLFGTFGVESSSLSPSGTNRILFPYVMAGLTVGTTEFVITNSISTNEINAVNTVQLINKNLGNITEARANVGQGGPGNVFILGKADYSSSHSSTPLGLYNCNQSGFTRAGSITPAQVDATWSHFIAARGVAWDQTDGNPIILVGTDDVVTNQYYFVKLNKATAAVIWTCPVNADNPQGETDMGRYIIKNQIMFYLGSSNLLYTINTATGAATTATIGSLTTAGGQYSEDVNQSIILQGAWTETTTHPTYLGAYMGAGGNHTITSGNTIRFFPNGFVGTQPTPAPATMSRRRCWSYSLDDHTFYVLDLGAEGTFVYDITTQQWSQFSTSGFVQWSVANGCMWGQRVVGSDLAAPTVWEHRMSALQDSDAFDVLHVVTGGLTTRNRVFRSVDALRLSGSLGELDDPAGVNISLRMSDDQGVTWTPYFVIALTEGSSNEIVWRSLGSFCAPGRIFEVSDTGGLLRIDGADAFIDGFDEDKSGDTGEGQ